MVLATEQLEVTCYPGHGFTIGSILDKTRGTELLWTVPHARFDDLDFELGPAGAASAATFDDGVLAGGWFPMFPTAGPTNAPDRHMHGELARIPWAVDAVSKEVLRCSTKTPRSGFSVSRTITVKGGSIRVETQARNDSEDTQTVTFGEHPCFSRSVFADGAIEVVRGSRTWTSTAGDPSASRLPDGTLSQWPLAEDRQGRVVDLTTIPADADGRHDHFFVAPASLDVILAGRGDGPSISLRWDREQMPQALIWEHFQPAKGLWGAAGDVIAIEPTNSPRRTFEEAAALGGLTEVLPNESISFWTSLEIK